MPAGGDSRPQQVPPIPGRHRTVSTRRSPCARPPPRRPLVHPRPHPGTTRDTTPRPPAAAPNVRAGPACEPASPSYAEPTTSAKPTKHISTGSSTLIPVSEPRENALFKSSTSYTKPTTRPGQPGARTVRRPLRHRTDTANTTKSWTPSSHGENRSWPTTPQGGYPTDPSKEPTTSTKSYAASPTGSPTPTITQPAESS